MKQYSYNDKNKTLLNYNVPWKIVCIVTKRNGNNLKCLLLLYYLGMFFINQPKICEI